MEVPTTVKNKELVEKKREQIVLAAIKLFSQKGFHGTTLRDLAEVSGLSYGSIYDYVGSKEDIFSLIHDFAANLVMETLHASIKNITDPIERLRRIVRAEFNVMDQWSDAILLIYQESHILSEPYLRMLLTKERQHLELIEQAIDQAIEAGKLKEHNSRLSANLIKSMVDSWVIKRWDLRGFVSRLEVEKGVLDFVFNGLLNMGESTSGPSTNRTTLDSFVDQGLQGKNILIVNGGTVLGSSICQAFVAKGAKIAIQSEPTSPTREKPFSCDESETGIRQFRTDSYGPLTPDLFDRIESETGPIDLLIQDLGLGTLSEDEWSREEAEARLTANLNIAEELAQVFMTDSRRSPSRIIFIAPWAWDHVAEPLRFKTVSAGIVALTRILSEALASKGATVNCIVPGYIRAARPSSLEKTMRDDLLERIPSGSLGDTVDVTETINHLVSDSAKYITGQVFEVSGGLKIN